MANENAQLKIKELESRERHFRRKSVRLLKAIRKAIDVLDEATKLRDTE